MSKEVNIIVVLGFREKFEKLSFNPEQIRNFRKIASTFCRASSILVRSSVVSFAYNVIFASLVLPDLKMGIRFTARSFLIRIASSSM